MQKYKNLHKIKDLAKKDSELVKKSLLNWTFIVTALKTLGLVLFYYTFSIGLTFYNKKFIGKYKLPLSITILHLVIKYVIAGVVRNTLECIKGERRVVLPWPMYIKKIAPAGVASSLDIGLSNWSFEFITVSLYTMSKSTSILFILGFALLLKLEKFRWSLVLVVLFISLGLFMFTYHSTQFNIIGFALCLTASFLSGIRWTLAQFVCQKHEIGLGNPVDMMWHIQPWMIAGLLPLSVGFEIMPLVTSNQFFAYTDVKVVTDNCLILGSGAIMAFFLEFSEFLLLTHTSGLTMAISGIFKEICTLYLAHKVNGDQMNIVNVFGLIACLSGITIHVIFKAIYRRKEQATEHTNIEEDVTEILLTNTVDSDGDETIYEMPS